MIGAVIFFGGVLLLCLVYYKWNTFICQPNELLVFSGKKTKLKDGTVVGYRVVKGGRYTKTPILETVQKISLAAIPIEIIIQKALTEGMIPVNVRAIAHIKVAGSEESGMHHAIERFLGRNISYIGEVAREVLEGSLRGVLATLTPEEANRERISFAERVREETKDDFYRLGLVLDTFKIENLSDEEGYLEAVGRRKNAQVRKDARIAEAEAEAEAKKVEAVAKQTSRIAEIEAEQKVIQNDHDFRVQKAHLEEDASKEEAVAKLAGEIAEIEETQKKEAARVSLNEKKFQAEVVVPAEAEKKALELKSEGYSARILENGKATAEAMQLMRKEWDEGKTKDLFLIQILPEIMDKITNVVKDHLQIDKLTIVDSGQGSGLPTHIRGITGSFVSMLEELKNATGIDLSSLVDKSQENKSLLKKELD